MRISTSSLTVYLLLYYIGGMSGLLFLHWRFRHTPIIVPILYVYILIYYHMICFTCIYRKETKEEPIKNMGTVIVIRRGPRCSNIIILIIIIIYQTTQYYYVILLLGLCACYYDMQIPASWVIIYLLIY